MEDSAKPAAKARYQTEIYIYRFVFNSKIMIVFPSESAVTTARSAPQEAEFRQFRNVHEVPYAQMRLSKGQQSCQCLSPH